MGTRENKEIDVFLNEYQAPHHNRNHYDSLHWTIGSIFKAASFALFDFSFREIGKDDF
jgi:hypothetical protein